VVRRLDKQYKSILLFKVPHCIHPDAVPENDNFRLKHTFRPIPSFALAALCAFLEKHNTFGYEIKAVDVNIEAYKKPGVPIEINEYPLLIEECIKKSRYDVLAISVMFVFNVKWLESLVSLSRLYHPAAKIIVGGGYPTIFPKDCLQQFDVDHVVIGEGEASFVHILNRYNDHHDTAFENKFPFDGYGEKKKSGEINIVPLKTYLHMEDIPVPAWDYLNVDKYFKNSGDRILAIEAVRGCPYRCTYCNTQLTWGHQLRYKKVDSLIEEMIQLNGKYRALLHFIDDNRSVNRDWMMDFLSKAIENNIPMDPTPSSFHVNHLDAEMIEFLKKGGIKTVGIGVETGSQEMQKRCEKNLNLDRVREVVAWIKSKGLRVHINYMFGFPHETLDQIDQTLDLARELNAHSNQFLLVVPYPGTAIYEEAKKDGLFRFEDIELDNFEPRRFKFLKSDEWTYAQLEEKIYDVNIELNFLDNPSLEDGEWQDMFLDYLENLGLRIPGHVIAHIVAGYIHKKKGNFRHSENHFRKAVKDLGKKEFSETFAGYLTWDYPAIRDFNQYCKAKGIAIKTQNPRRSPC
jgi:anaerobic magnesium-protoporphyrin IX monomethyl ester cyclase